MHELAMCGMDAAPEHTGMYLLPSGDVNFMGVFSQEQILNTQLNNQQYTSGKVVCVGRNYAEHAKELSNPVPKEPILFIKPASSLVPMNGNISIPTDQGSVHHELEIAILIGQELKNASEDQVSEAVAGIGLALDLTLRDVQSKLKEKGHPWERAKSFDGACPVSEFISPGHFPDLNSIHLKLERNGKLQQQGSSNEMLFPIVPLIAEMSRHFTLNSGDIVLTGTPAGVGPLESGDNLQSSLGTSDEDVKLRISTKVI